MNPIELEQLAVMFRANDPNLAHVSVLNQMEQAGLAYTYGVFRGTPPYHKRERARLRASIADTLCRKAKGGVS